MIPRPVVLCTVAVLVLAMVGVTAPAHANTYFCPTGGTQHLWSPEASGEEDYVDDLLLCASISGETAILYNNSDQAWWFTGSAEVVPTAGSLTTGMMQSVTDRYEDPPYVYFLPGDSAWISDIGNVHWWLDPSHTAGWMITDKIADKTSQLSDSGFEYLAALKGKTAKALWSCMDGALDLGATVVDEEVTGRDLIKAGLDGVVTTGACGKAWKSAAKAPQAKAAGMPTFEKVTTWAKRGSSAIEFTADLEFLYKLCRTLCH